ncbi:MAG: hypothetical protein ACOX1J_10845 [Dethiobacteria bacterium]|jgi:hypothetical protein
MKKDQFEQTWSRINNNAGGTFYTKTGLEYSYKIDSNGFYPSTTEYRISSFRIKKNPSLLWMQILGRQKNGWTPGKIIQKPSLQAKGAIL